MISYRRPEFSLCSSISIWLTPPPPSSPAYVVYEQPLRSTRTGKYKNDARDASNDYLTNNFFFFTVDTNTATSGNVKGGGYGCSVGPVTIEA